MSEFDRRQPAWVPLRLHCADGCDLRWRDWQPSGVAAAVWIAWADTLHCPRCGIGPKGVRIILGPGDTP